MSFIAELKRRNVIRTAVAYLAAAWLLIQVFESLLPVFGLPDTSMRYVFAVLGIGFVPVMFAAWVLELTPEGLMRDSGDARVDPAANRRFDRIIIVILVLAVTLFAAHTFIIDPARDAAQIEKATRDARTGAFKESFGEKSIAVLPFTNMSADPDQEFFGDGIAEELLNLLAKVEGLRVISRTSSFQFKDSGLSLAEIAEKLDVATVLEGSVQLSGNKLRITAQLIDAHADAHLWSEKYDRELDDVFSIQDEVAAQVVEQLKITLAVGIPKVQRHSPEAYALYLQAKQIVELDNPELVGRAVELLHRVLEIEEDYVDAQLALSLAYYQLASSAFHDNNNDLADDYIAEFQRIQDVVLTLDPKNAMLNAALGWRAMMERRNWSAAARHAELAVESEPRNYDALLLAAALSGDLGRTSLAIRIYEYITRRMPMGYWAHSNLGGEYHSSGQLDKALTSYRTAAAISPSKEGAQWRVGIVLLMSGDPEAALAQLEFEKHREYQLHGQVLAFHDMGDRERSATALAELVDRVNMIDGPEGWDFGLARAYAWLNDADNAFKYLYRHQAKGPGALVGVGRNPYFQKIREDPRWQPLVDSVEEEFSQIQFNPKLPPEILAQQ